MIRCILKREIRDGQDYFQSFETLDINAPAIEVALCRGGRGEDAYDRTSLVGVEIVKPAAAEVEA